jgi:redox-sensitive bicupin YhaK (pirin superfamily)
LSLVPDRCTSEAPAAPLIEAWPARHTRLGALDIRRALPLRERRLVGPWCFLDRYGPLTFTEGKPMDLAPHPHIGLQTVSWLMEGEIVHTDSLGYEALLRPGGVNLMTSGRGIAHAEETPSRSSGRLSGVQLWIALPEASRHGEPNFEHLAELPQAEFGASVVTTIMGDRSPGSAFSPIVGADIRLRNQAEIPLRRDFEHALFVLEGRARLEDQDLAPDILYYLGTGRDAMALATRDGARLLLLGGAPFGETILMWWNFVARTQEEIVAASEDWNEGRRFGRVRGHEGIRVPTPPLRGRAKPPAAS